MHLSENEGIENNSFVVTGGLGFVGSALCLELVRRGARIVKAFDLRTHSPWSHQLRQNGVHFIQGDITDKQDVQKALRGADCVFHLASYGMSGKEMLQYRRVDEVNINGTCHIIDTCVEHQIKRLVYVSTCNVVYGGKEIVNGNENLPYFPVDDHVDPYGRSKSIAEQLVLKSNGRPFNKKNGKCLYTCAIRPAAIYGPGEERHLPRIITLAKLGLLPFKIGSPNVKSDWVYVDNLVLALLLASMGLLDDIPGRWDFINSGKETVKGYAPDPVKKVYNTTYYYSAAAVRKIDDVVRVNGIQKLGQYIPDDDEGRAKIVSFSTKFVKNASVYAVKEAPNFIPGGKAVTKIYFDTVREMETECQKKQDESCIKEITGTNSSTNTTVRSKL